MTAIVIKALLNRGIQMLIEGKEYAFNAATSTVSVYCDDKQCWIPCDSVFLKTHAYVQLALIAEYQKIQHKPQQRTPEFIKNQAFSNLKQMLDSRPFFQKKAI